MLTINLSSVEFNFDGNNKIIAKVPKSHGYNLSVGPVKIQLMHCSPSHADIIAISANNENKDYEDVTINYLAPIVY